MALMRLISGHNEIVCYYMVTIDLKESFMLGEYEELLCFAAVTRCGSVTAAAELLSCSKAHISRKLSALEKRLETKLMHRSTRQIHYTDAGQRLLPEAHKMLASVESARLQSRNLQQELTGRFVITAPISFSTYVLAPVMIQLQKAFPLIQFELIPTNDVVDLLDREVDLGIRMSNVVNTNLVARQIGTMKEIFLASSEFYQTHSLQDINDLPWQKLLLNPVYLKQNRMTFCCHHETVELDLSGTTKIRDNPVIVEMLMQSDYISWLPDYCRGITKNNHQLEHILPQYCGIEWPVYLVFPFQVPLPLKLHKVAEFLQSELSVTLSRE